MFFSMDTYLEFLSLLELLFWSTDVDEWLDVGVEVLLLGGWDGVPWGTGTARLLHLRLRWTKDREQRILIRLICF